jgi:hypothetical protein
MFGGLVIPQVGIDPTGSEAVHEVPGNDLGGSHQFQQQFVVGLLHGKQGFNMPFGEQNDMVFPEWPGVVKGKDMFVLEVHRNVQKPFQDLIAIKVTHGIGHFSFPCN